MLSLASPFAKFILLLSTVNLVYSAVIEEEDEITVGLGVSKAASAARSVDAKTFLKSHKAKFIFGAITLAIILTLLVVGIVSQLTHSGRDDDQAPSNDMTVGEFLGRISPGKAVLFTAMVMSLVGAVGVGVWIYIKSRRRP
jgi:hypothetical protein